MIDLLDLPALARDVLRRYAAERVAAKLPVVWFDENGRRTAEPRDDKYTGAWLVGSEGWESYWPTERVLEALACADAVGLVE